MSRRWSPSVRPELVEGQSLAYPLRAVRPFYLYILECSDGSYYVGHTDDLPTRVAQHESGSLGGSTATRKVLRLAYSCEFASREDALARERQIKNWSRAKKQALIAQASPSTSSGRTEPE